MVNTDTKTVNVLNDGAHDIVMFPDHPAFQIKPPGLVSFVDYMPRGIFMTLGAASPSDGSQEDISNTAALKVSKEEEGLVSSPDVEVDADGIPTIDLLVEHSVNRFGKKKGVNATVLRLDKGQRMEAWKRRAAGRRSLERTGGTWKGKSFGV